MASKKYSFLVGLLGLLSFSAAQAQTGSATIYRGSNYDVYDSTIIPAKRMDQQRDFLNRNIDFPAKPRNMWEIGFGVGMLNISGDVRSKSFYNRPLKGQAIKGTMAWNVSLRKAWGYVISTRLQYIQGAAHGYSWQGTQSYYNRGASNPYYNAYQGATGTPPAVRDAYRTTVKELDLQMIAALNNIKFHKARNKMSTYGLFGVGGLLYSANQDIRNAAGVAYTTAFNGTQDSIFNAMSSAGTSTGTTWTNGYKSARTIIENNIQDEFDGVFETSAERHNNRFFAGENTFRPVATAGLGVQFKLGRRFTLGIEEKVTFTMDDLLDGRRWQEPANVGNPVVLAAAGAMTRDYDNINYLSVNLGVNLGANSVAPLWWLNPMDYAYNELSTGRRANKQVDNCATQDADGDGVSDCFDKCNDTPLGVAVDMHGCCLDTDGDGVCDYKDKQLITPTECQPVNADGIGKCPDPECCKNPPVEEKGCGSINNGMISFTNNTTALNASAKSQLNNVANQLRDNPSCNLVVAGNGTTKLEGQRSWMRAKAVIDYLNSQGIDRDRLCFEFGNSGTPSTVDYHVAAKGSNCGYMPPPPNPQLK